MRTEVGLEILIIPGRPLIRSQLNSTTNARNIYLFILFISLIHQQSYQTVAAKGIRHADGKARPTGTYSFPDKLSLKTNSVFSVYRTSTRPPAHDYSLTEKCSLHASHSLAPHTRCQSLAQPHPTSHHFNHPKRMPRLLVLGMAPTVNCTKFGQLILRIIIKIDATRCQIFRLKCTTIAPSQTPLGRLQRSPDPLAGLKGSTSKGRGGGMGWDGRGRGVKGVKGRGRRGGEGTGPQYFIAPQFQFSRNMLVCELKYLKKLWSVSE